jgi:hypothetical protein
MEPRRPSPTVVLTHRSGFAHGQAVTAWTLWAVSVLFIVISVLTSPSGSDLVASVAQGVAALSFATVGAVLASRLPGNVIGWLLALGGLCFALISGAAGLAELGLIVHPGSVPGAIWFAWLTQWIWAPAIGAVIGLALVYPTGRLLSARWRGVAVAAVLVIALLAVGSAVTPWSDGLFPEQNPLELGGGALTILDDLLAPAVLIAVVVAVLAVASLVIRYRRGVSIERAQLRWFAAVAAICMPALLIGLTLSWVFYLIAFGAFALLPVAIGIAVLRYRLFEIDRLISRTISYGVLTAIVGGLFVGFILVFQVVLAPLTQSNELAVAGSTLLVSALFQPLRRRVQRLVDRRFNRSRYDAQRTVAAFANRLRDEVDLEQLQAEILATVSASVEPVSVSLWLRQ